MKKNVVIYSTDKNHVTVIKDLQAVYDRGVIRGVIFGVVGTILAELIIKHVAKNKKAKEESEEG